MKILVIGGGGREHALVWKLRQSPQVEKIWCAPGNGGISDIAECVPGNPGDVAALAKIAEQLKVDLTVVGPEQPLVLGVADKFASRELALVGPSREAARLEGSKVFAKEFMQRHDVPTASLYGIFDRAEKARDALRRVQWPVVIKADGLCGGKGVLVAASQAEADAFIGQLMEQREFGEAGRQVILEEGLAGEEISYIGLADGETFVPLAPSRDYKRAFDNDKGPNTGGMGAISSDELISVDLEEEIQKKIVRPTIAGMAQEGRPFRGFLYFGIMVTKNGAKVLEFNCRLGDPETEALVMRMNFDLAQALHAAANAKLRNIKFDWAPKASACIVLASEGYPGKPQTGKKIEGLGATKEEATLAVFHAATRKEGSNYYTSSGRVLTVAASAESIAEAREKAYRAAARISFEGMHCRRDVGSPTGAVAKGGEA